MSAVTQKAVAELDRAGGVWLTWLLIFLAAFLLWVAFYEDSTLIKAATAAWVMFP